MLTNYHTHTAFCDGKNSAEEMVLSAIDYENGFAGGDKPKGNLLEKPLLFTF